MFGRTPSNPLPPPPEPPPVQIPEDPEANLTPEEKDARRRQRELRRVTRDSLVIAASPPPSTGLQIP